MSLRKRLYILIFGSYKKNNSATVKYAFPMIFAFAALLGATSLLSDAKSYIHLESSMNSLVAGDTFQIKVYVSTQVPVNAVDISLLFPKNQISILGIDTGESVITLWTKEPSVENNKVTLSGGTFRRGFIGDHLIATINAKATETGVAKFSVDTAQLLAGDGSGSSVSVSKTGEDVATIYVNKADGTKVPSATAIGIKGDTSVVIVTDLDGDGKVTLTDISRFMGAWQLKTSMFDFNGDGAMTFKDFGIILSDSFLR